MNIQEATEEYRSALKLAYKEEDNGHDEDIDTRGQ